MKILCIARENFLFKDGIPYVKKDIHDRFNVPMGARDGVEVSELSVLYFLYKLAEKNGHFEKLAVGLY